jgi:predicted dehydrogenase
MNRRNFVMLAAGAATASAMDKPAVAIGFLGAVHSHFDGKLEAARAIGDLRIVGVCEKDPKAQGALRKQSVPLLSREELLHHPEIQVIAVESAVRDHAPDGLAVLQAGKHLHLEKAPADNTAAFQRIVQTARAKNLRLQVGYIYRRHPGITKAAEAMRNGWLGDVYLVRANIGNQLAANRRPEWAEFAGGVMYELGGHVIDPVVRMMGRPKKITAALHKDGKFDDTLKDNTVALLEWEKATGVVQSATLQPGATRYRAFEVFGSNGTFVVNPLEPGAASVELEKAAGPYAAGMQKLTLPKFARYRDDLRDMVAAIRGEAELPVSLDQDLMVHEALLRCSGMYEGKA